MAAWGGVGVGAWGRSADGAAAAGGAAAASDDAPLDEDNTCSICMAARESVCFVPCSHKVCEGCVGRFRSELIKKVWEPQHPSLRLLVYGRLSVHLTPSWGRPFQSHRFASCMAVDEALEGRRSHWGALRRHTGTRMLSYALVVLYHSARSLPNPAPLHGSEISSAGRAVPAGDEQQAQRAQAPVLQSCRPALAGQTCLVLVAGTAGPSSQR